MQMVLTGLVSPQSPAQSQLLSPVNVLVLGPDGLLVGFWLVDPKKLNPRHQGFLLRRKC